MITTPAKARKMRCIQDIGRGNSNYTAPCCPAWEFYVPTKLGMEEQHICISDEEKAGYCGLSAFRPAVSHPERERDETVLQL